MTSKHFGGNDFKTSNYVNNDIKMLTLGFVLNPRVRRSFYLSKNSPEVIFS